MATGLAVSASASVIGPIDGPLGSPDDELARVILELNSNSGTNDYDDLVILGKINTVEDVALINGVNSENSGSGLGLDIKLKDVSFDGSENTAITIDQTEFMSGGMTYDLTAVLVKAKDIFIYFDDMYTAMIAPETKGISHFTYFGLKTDSTVVPVPASVAFLLTGLVGLFAVRRRKHA